MDNVANLEALREEEAESVHSDSDGEEKGDGGIRRGDPNKFDSLCDGVLGTLALVHASMQEMLELKDELTKHDLPANVLTQISLSTSKLFRSIGDMHMPMHELIRMVRIYSTPWEEKSAALKKLHDDYDAKKSQLNIAIKRLQLVDAQSRRMNREKRLMNWEKLFCRITTTRGHGRRWKFLIDSFKKKAQEGIPALQGYLDEMEMGCDSEDDEEPEPIYPETQIQIHVEPSEDELAESEQVVVKNVAESSKKDHKKDSESEAETSEDETPVTQIEVATVPAYVPPPMKDTETYTGELDYDRHLYVRVYKPEGLDYRELRCRLVCGKETYKTDVLDLLPEDKLKTNTKQATAGKMPEDDAAKRGRGPGLRGTRSRPGDSPIDSTLKTEDLTKDKQVTRYEECLFSMPEKERLGIWKPDKKSVVPPPEHIRVSVHYSPKQEMIAMATIDMDDLVSLDLQTVILPLPEDSADVIHAADLQYLESDAGDDTSTQGSAKSESLHSTHESKFNFPQKYWKAPPVNFPLYLVESGHGDAVHMPCGQLPIVFFWAKQIKPRTFHKMTEADTTRDIVLDLTGIDLYLTTKEEINPETLDRAISAMSVQSEEKPETVLRSDYNRLLMSHSEEMQMLQAEYEQRLQDLADNLQQMQEEAERQQLQQQEQQVYTHVPSRSTTRSTSPQRLDPRSPHPPPREIKQPPPQPRPRKRVATRTPPHWGEHLPKDFLERLRWFEEASIRHKQEVADKTNKETSDHYEKKLAGEFKLGGPGDEDATYNPMQDVSLPAVFMPSKGRDLTIYNPRASQYFHATGSSGLRLTQPPSMVQLPPLPKNKVNVVNLFDVSNNFRPGGNEWLIERYMFQQQLQQQQRSQQHQQQHQPQQQQQHEEEQDGILEEGTEMYESSHGYTPYTPTAQQEILGNYPMKESMME